jgi:hypothetical protein
MGPEIGTCIGIDVSVVWMSSSGLGMFVAKNEEIIPVAKTRALYAPDTRFRKWVTSGNEIARNQPKHEFWT